MAKWYDEEEQRQGAQVQVYPSSIQALIGRMTR
jgi:hypothetical protein